MRITPQQLSSGKWRTQITVGGKRISITKKTPEAVIEEARRITILHEEGVEHRKTASIRLGDAIDEYISSRSNVLSVSTLRGYRAYRRVRFPRYMTKPVGKIDWQKMINEEARTCSPKTVKNAWGLVKSAIAEYGIEPSVRLPTPKPTEKEWLTPEQIPLFMKAVEGKPVELGALLALSGLRRSEIYGLDWKDIDLERKVIHIHQSLLLNEDAKAVIRNQNKTASSTRDVPIFLPRLYTALCEAKEQEGRIIPENLSTLRKRITRACEDAGVPDIGVHGLRHSFCSLCYSLGISEKACMELGGWSDYQTMRRIYTHISEADKQKSADALESFFTQNTLTKEIPTAQSLGAQAL